MKKFFLTASSVALVTISICAQSTPNSSIPDSELIARIKANRSHFPEIDHGESLKDTANKSGKDVLRHVTVMVDQGQCMGCPKPDPNDDPVVKQATTNSDIVVIGRAVRNISALTQNEAFVFTDSEFIIDEIWKNAGSSEADPSVSQGSEITILRPGGEVRSNGHRISISLSTDIPLKVGHKYLLYLKYLPDSRSYDLVGFGGFDISSLAVVPLKPSEFQPSPNLMSNEPSFLQALHSSTMHALEEAK